MLHSSRFALTGLCVLLLLALSAPSRAALLDGGFEVPDIPPAGDSSGHVYNPDVSIGGSAWTYYGYSGIIDSPSAFGAPAPVDGNQIAFLQHAHAGLVSADGSSEIGSIHQTFTLGPGTYELNISDARRGGQLQPYVAYLDGRAIFGPHTPESGAAFTSHTSSQFSITGGTHTLSIAATSHAGDLTAFIDAVSFTQVAGERAIIISDLYNTGVGVLRNGNDRTPLEDGAVDSHYTLISAPAGATLGAAKVIVDDGFPISGGPGGGSPWLENTGTSKWIGHSNGDNNSNGPAGTYVYRTTFDLTGLDHTLALVEGLWATDDPGLDILINGVSTGNASAGFGGFTAFSISSGFVAGLNTLDFVVSNGGGPTGLHVQVSGVILPEPATLTLLALGALPLLRRRRTHA